MTDATHMQLVFRLGGMGFVLPIGDLVEVREAVIPAPASDPAGESPETPEVIDLRSRFGLPGPGMADGPLLVLCGRCGPWMLPVDCVEGIFPASEFTLRPLPELLSRTEPGPCRELAMWREEALQACQALELEALGREG
jgi:purine-binding chemotaxis protein CheW